MQYFGYIVLSLVILLVMVLIHETGHYTVAKILGFTVDEFSIGFGPKLLSRRRKNGELFSLRIFPLGGFCAFYGETDDSDAAADGTPKTAPDAAENKENRAETEQAETAEKPQDAEEDLLTYVMKNKPADEAAPPVTPTETPRLDKDGNPAKTFNQQKPWKRILVLLGGVLFNFLSAFVFSLIFIWSIGYSVPVIDSVYTDADGAPYVALREGDVIIAVDGKSIDIMQSFEDIAAEVGEGNTVTLTVLRDGERIEVRATRRLITVADADGKTTEYVGFGFVSGSTFIGNDAANAFKYCVPYTFKLSWSILGSFGGLFTGKVPVTSITGPVGSINMMAQLATANARNILILLPLLASNLAIFNLLPFPALDGAHIVFTIIEWIRKKPINRKVEGMIHFVGLIVLLLFVVVIDILSFAL